MSRLVRPSTVCVIVGRLFVSLVMRAIFCGDFLIRVVLLLSLFSHEKRTNHVLSKEKMKTKQTFVGDNDNTPCEIIDNCENNCREGLEKKGKEGSYIPILSSI